MCLQRAVAEAGWRQGGVLREVWSRGWRESTQCSLLLKVWCFWSFIRNTIVPANQCGVTEIVGCGVAGQGGVRTVVAPAASSACCSCRVRVEFLVCRCVVVLSLALRRILFLTRTRDTPGSFSLSLDPLHDTPLTASPRCEHHPSGLPKFLQYAFSSFSPIVHQFTRVTARVISWLTVELRVVVA